MQPQSEKRLFIENADAGILAWKIPWTEEPGGLQSMGSHDWAHTHERGGRKWKWVGSNKQK